MPDSPPAPPGAPPPRAIGPRTLLADRDFRGVWAVGVATQTMRWLEMLAISVFIFRATGSPMAVALVMFLRQLPMFLLGAVAGAVADRFDRRIMLIVGMAAMCGLAIILGGLVATERIEIWHIALGVFLNGMYWSMDFPVRRTVLGEIAGMDRLSAAMGLDAATTQMTRMAGPAIGGLVIEAFGMEGVYLLGVVFYGAACLLMLRVTYRPARSISAGDANVVSKIAEGFRYVGTRRVIVGTLAVTVMMNVWGFPYVSMVPVIGEQVLGLSAFFIGLLVTAEATGALCSSLLIANFIRPVHYMRLYVGSACLFITGVLAFSLSPSYALSLAILFIGGFGFAGFGTMQPSIIIYSTPPAVRSRVMGAITVCIGTGPLGILHLGWLASILDAPMAVMVMAIEGMVVLAACLLIWPELRRPTAPPPD